MGTFTTVFIKSMLHLSNQLFVADDSNIWYQVLNLKNLVLEYLKVKKNIYIFLYLKKHPMLVAWEYLLFSISFSFIETESC